MATVVLKSLAIPVILPLALTIAVLKIKLFRSKATSVLNIPLEDKGFIGFITSKESWSQFGLMFLLIFIALQIFIVPLLPIPRSMGKFTNIKPTQMPSIIYTFVIFGLIPIQLSKVIISMIGVKETDDAYTNIKPFALITSFFLITFLVQVIGPFELITTLVLFTLLDKSGSFNKILSSFSVSINDLDNTTQFNRIFVLLLFVFGITATTLRYIPGYNDISSMLNSKLGFFGQNIQGLGNHGINIATFLLLPLAVGKSLEYTTTHMNTLQKGQGFNVGYILGVLLGLLVQNFSGKTLKLEIETLI